MNARQPQLDGIIAPPPLLYVSALGLAFVTDFVSPKAIFLPTPKLYIAGFALVLISAVFARWAFVTMKNSGTSASPEQPSVALTTTGPFKFTRNPIYVAMTGIYFGVAALGNTMWPFLCFIPLAVVMHHAVVLREELYLTQKFGNAYLVYKLSTRRWI